MTQDFSELLVYEALSRVCTDAASIKAVIGVNMGTVEMPLVRPLGDELPDLPAIFLVPGPWSIIAGGAERHTHTALGTIFGPREGLEGVVAVMTAFAQLRAAFRAHSQVYRNEPLLQSCLITEGPGLQAAEWPRDSEVWHVTWPFEIEVKVNTNALYTAA